jgi:hypothetical protein
MGSPEIVVESEPLFNSAHAALVFAFNFSGQSERSTMAKMAAPTGETGKGLGGLDGAAQAGMIRQELQSMGKLAEAILVARIAPRATPCSCRSPCCSGYRPNPEWTSAIGHLADHIRNTALAGCTSNALLRRAYVVRYFTPKDKRISLEALASQHEVDRHSVSAHNAKVFALFGGTQAKAEKSASMGLEHAAMYSIDDRLREIGMVG